MRRGPARGVPPWVPMQVALAPQAFLSISTCLGTQGSSQAGVPEVWTPACLPCHPALSYSLREQCPCSAPAAGGHRLPQQCAELPVAHGWEMHRSGLSRLPSGALPTVSTVGLKSPEWISEECITYTLAKPRE